MFIRDVITQLRKELPLYTDKFSEQVGISSASFSGGVVTIVTNSAHGLSDGDIVNIVDCKEKVPISDITTVSDVATVTTSVDHDQTLDYQDSDDQPPFTIIESSVVDYNGSFDFINIPTRTTFTFAITGSPASASDGFLLRDSVDGYSGIKEVTVVDSTSFTFTTAKTLTANGYLGSVHKDLRISGGVDAERTILAYSKQEEDDYWLFAIPESTTASKSGNIQNDVTDQNIKGNEFRQKTIPLMDIYMFVPSSDDYSGRAAYDSVLEESVALFKSLLGWRVPTPYSIVEYASITLENHQPFFYEGPFYVHKFQFSTVQEIVCDDLFVEKGDVAFRDIEMNVKVDFGTENTQTDIKLDQ